MKLASVFNQLISRVFNETRNWFGSLNQFRKILFPLTFLTLHVAVSIGLGRMYALAPDESGYLYTFNNLYGDSPDANPQYNSGWITAPKAFLWVVYSPAKMLTLAGVPDYLAIRLLSISLMFLCYLILRSWNRDANGRNLGNLIFVFLFIPSVFLWSSVGLRETFLFVEIAAILKGLTLLYKGSNSKGAILLILGSYGLVSTKSYLWACFVVAIILCSLLFFFMKVDKSFILKLIAFSIVCPLVMFASTTSVYALSFIFQSDITETGKRSGESVTNLYVDSSGNASTSLGVGETIGSNSQSGVNVPKKIEFRGDYTLIALHLYFAGNPNSLLTKVLSILKIKDKVESIWAEKIELGLITLSSENKKDTSSLNGQVLKPGVISDPISMIGPALSFLFGPFPFNSDSGLAAMIASLESPLWWILYLVLFSQILRVRKLKIWNDPPLIIASVYSLGFIAFSSLVEVNLGTSFRHRSIILILVIFIFLRIRESSVKINQNSQ
jgi:hypothetical protein